MRSRDYRCGHVPVVEVFLEYKRHIFPCPEWRSIQNTCPIILLSACRDDTITFCYILCRDKFTCMLMPNKSCRLDGTCSGTDIIVTYLNITCGIEKFRPPHGPVSWLQSEAPVEGEICRGKGRGRQRPREAERQRDRGSYVG